MIAIHKKTISELKSKRFIMFTSAVQFSKLNSCDSLEQLVNIFRFVSHCMMHAWCCSNGCSFSPMLSDLQEILLHHSMAKTEKTFLFVWLAGQMYFIKKDQALVRIGGK